ncbi:glycosyl transferase [candidate division WOR-1 bacterium RIFOXYB2_FULL_42_35]|uniref:Glycosyl transferase n=1 Tax=candidate division WOR-1 bacterium RIFOXYC2_FULL_41_25 TaxID=1802586 RepID=A0A1F4TIU6_UNCSA|nr:MAG: glycosyl transferase [candidate division WOR-1 bacterium RIFOXYA2_FULL_41_14]OGC24027.1 MAG: glycosyl transferase [candidate division WOR-1 bacterium RIFOXYB2_FULL_42_35]OGC32450.1 MAG: glycosyl transferase [candidate division WOR-1 bacterium RIFOXYC2_FULL_41_25]OGC43830.1 MAG: glycosyl transferase [candidate division WOR-1 bacterium RIFOXYD2_FULL_41_8]
MRIAIVHDYLNQFGGAERVISALHEVFPDAPIFTSIYDENRMPASFKKMDIRVSFMQRFPFVFKLFKFYLLFYPLAFESFDLKGYDVILSSSSAFAKGVKKRPGQVHICYCYTPMRFVWRYDDYVKREGFGSVLKLALAFVLKPIRNWDLLTTKGVDFFIAISKTIQDRVLAIYGRKSEVIYPPVDTQLYKISPVDKDYFLVVSRLNAYKRVDLVVQAFNELGLPLKIIGTGPDLKNLRRLANDNIEFLGRQADKTLVKYYAECRAFIFPGEEDFGIAPVEAMSAGRPVIAYQAGGATETIIAGKTGLFFKEQTVASLVEAVQRCQFKVFNKEVIRAQALKFSKEIFQQKVKQFIEEKGKE